ncbi:hypothetical protein D3C81_1728160 [compost metagenome]
MFDKGLGLFEEVFTVSRRQHRQAPLQQLFTQRRHVGVQAPLDVLEQAAGLPLLTQALRHGNGLITLGMPDQYQQVLVQRLLHALLGALYQGIGGLPGHQFHEVGR